MAPTAKTITSNVAKQAATKNLNKSGKGSKNKGKNSSSKKNSGTSKKSGNSRKNDNKKFYNSKDKSTQIKENKYATTVKIGDNEINISAPTRGTFKKLVKELSQSQAFANKPASVRNLETISKTLITMETIDETLAKEGYSQEAALIKSQASAFSSLLDKAAKDDKVAEILANALNKGNINSNTSSGEDTVISI